MLFRIRSLNWPHIQQNWTQKEINSERDRALKYQTAITVTIDENGVLLFNY